MKKSITNYLTQICLIVFSVVLGIFLSERIEEGKRKRESGILFATIQSELKDNIRILNKWVPYHEEVHQKLDSLAKDEGFLVEFITDRDVLYAKLLKKGTFMGESPGSDAWDIAKSHPRIVNIDYEKLYAISRIYKQQEITFEPGMEMFKIMQSKDVNKPGEAEVSLALMLDRMFELVARERQLVFYYQEGIEILGLKDDSEGGRETVQAPK